MARWIARTPSIDLTRHRSLPKVLASQDTTESRLPMVARCRHVMPALSRSAAAANFPARTLGSARMACRHLTLPYSAATCAHVSPRAFLASRGMLQCCCSHLEIRNSVQMLRVFFLEYGMLQGCYGRLEIKNNVKMLTVFVLKHGTLQFGILQLSGSEKQGTYV